MDEMDEIKIADAPEPEPPEQPPESIPPEHEGGAPEQGTEQPFYHCVMTEKGLSLLSKQQLVMAGYGNIDVAEILDRDERARIHVTRAVAGEGHVDPVLLEQQTEILLPIAEMELGPHEIVAGDPRAVRLRMRLSSEVIGATAFIRQVGVFAMDPDEGEILYSILQYRFDAPQPLSTTAASYGAISFFESEVILVFANGKATSIPQSPGWFLTRDDLIAHDKDPEAHEGRFKTILERVESDNQTMVEWQERQDVDVQIIKDTLITETVHKLMVVFDNLSGIHLIRGVYNAAQSRIEC